MLRKLMKYEFMATGRVFLPLFAALLLLSLINRLLAYLPVEAPQVIGMVVSVILMVGIMVIALVLTLQRFRRNLLSTEGYLMNTLPVSTDKLILSKMFVATIWAVASAIVVALSIMLMAMTSFSFNDLSRVFKPLGEVFSTYPLESLIVTIEVLLGIVLVLFAGILLLYACMSLSMLVNKRRGLFTFGAFVVFITVIQTVLAVAISIIAVMNFASVDISQISTFGVLQTVILFWLALEAAVCAVFYFITRYMLRRRLNLQ